MAIGLIDFVNQTTEPMKRGIVQVITNESVFMRRLRFIPVDGFAYRYNRQQTLGGIAFRNLNQSYTPDQGVVNPLVESLAIFGGEVRTDRQIVNKQGDVARANAIAAKVKKASLFFDKYCIDGDPGIDPTQFYGLNARLTGNQVMYSQAGANGAALVVADVMTLQDRVVGANSQKVLVMNKQDRRALTTLVVTAAGGAAVRDVGSLIDNFNGSPIEVVDEDGDEAAILGKDETRGSSNLTSSMYCIRFGGDPDGEYVQGLINNNMIEHVDVGLLGTFYSDLVESNVGMAMFHPRSAARLAGIL